MKLAKNQRRRLRFRTLYVLVMAVARPSDQFRAALASDGSARKLVAVARRAMSLFISVAHCRSLCSDSYSDGFVAMGWGASPQERVEGRRGWPVAEPRRAASMLSRTTKGSVAPSDDMPRKLTRNPKIAKYC